MIRRQSSSNTDFATITTSPHDIYVTVQYRRHQLDADVTTTIPTSPHQYRRHYINTDVTTLHRRHYTTPTSPHDTDLAAALVLVEVDETADAADDVTVFVHDDERGGAERRLRVDQRVKVQQHVVTHAGVSIERATLHTLA